MDFEKHIAEAKGVTSLADANKLLEEAFANASKVIGGATDEQLFEPIPDRTIMDGAPRRAIVSAITDHTAHHRGALEVYARLGGKEPPMPYAGRRGSGRAFNAPRMARRDAERPTGRL